MKRHVLLFSLAAFVGTLPAAHGALLVGVLPLATALYTALRGHERPSRGFWGMAVLGSSLVAAYALVQGGGALHMGDLLVFGAVAAAGRASRHGLSENTVRPFSWQRYTSCAAAGRADAAMAPS